MNVREMIDILKQCDPDAEVIMSKDGEGNDFSPFEEYGNGWYLPKTTWYGEFYSNEDYQTEFEDDDERQGLKKAIVLWPTN